MCFRVFTKRFHDYTPRYRIPHAYRMRSGAGYICFFRDHSLSSAFSIEAYRSFFKRAFRNVRPFARREGKNLERVTNDARQKRCLREIHASRYAVARICEIGLIFFRIVSSIIVGCTHSVRGRERNTRRLSAT